MIRLDGVGSRIAGHWVLRDVDLQVAAGEVVGLTGPTLCGKSLLLAVCAMLVTPDTGRIEIARCDTRTDPGGARHALGYVGEGEGFYPDMTVRDDVEFFARAQGLGRWHVGAGVEEVLGRLRLGPVAGVRMAHGSRGLRRLVALARALIHRPRVLLLDDPTSGLDPDACDVVRRELRRHADGGGSALVVAADSRSLPHPDRVTVIRRGRVEDADRLAAPLGSAS